YSLNGCKRQRTNSGGTSGYGAIERAGKTGADSVGPGWDCRAVVCATAFFRGVPGSIGEFQSATRRSTDAGAKFCGVAGTEHDGISLGDRFRSERQCENIP